MMAYQVVADQDAGVIYTRLPIMSFRFSKSTYGIFYQNIQVRFRRVYASFSRFVSLS